MTKPLCPENPHGTIGGSGQNIGAAGPYTGGIEPEPAPEEHSGIGPPAVGLSIVVPVYNSARSLPLLHERLVGALDGRSSFELLLVDDCSHDGSWQVARDLAQSDRRVKALRLGSNCGQQRALLVGLAHASGDIIVTMDDDLQHRPEDIPLLLDALTVGRRMVVFASARVRTHPLWRRAGSWSFNLPASLLLGKPIGLRLVAFRAFDAQTCDAVLRLKVRYPLISAMLLRVAAEVVSVPVTADQAALPSRYSGRSLARTARGYSSGASVQRLRILAVLGGIMALVAFASLPRGRSIAALLLGLCAVGAGRLALSTSRLDEPQPLPEVVESV